MINLKQLENQFDKKNVQHKYSMQFGIVCIVRTEI